MHKRFFLLLMILTTHCLSINLTIEEKVGQLLMVHFNGQIANDDAKKLIQQAHVGGFIYYEWANELSSPQQVLALSNSLQQVSSKLPLLIAIDQEGGRISRLKPGFTSFPSQQTIEQTHDPLLAYKTAKAIGLELRNVGINLNFAPVADVNNNPLNPVIGDRAFGSDPHRVTQFCEQALRGYQEAGIIATLKHFPGHGDVEVDSHYAIPIIHKSIEKLDAVELFPFQQLSSKTPTILTAHLSVPAIDPVHCSTVSTKTINGLLREKFGFQGVIITDSLAMEGALKQAPSLEELVLQSFLAGHDLLLLGGKQLAGEKSGFEITPDQVLSVSRYLVDAVKSKRISEERLNASIERILKLKKDYGVGS